MKKLYWNFENHALKFPHLSVFCVFLFSIQQETNCTKRWQSTWGIKKLISWKMTWLCVTFCAAEFECYFVIMLCVKAWINVTKRLRGDSDVDGTCIPQVWILHLACETFTVQISLVHVKIQVILSYSCIKFLNDSFGRSLHWSWIIKLIKGLFTANSVNFLDF